MLLYVQEILTHFMYQAIEKLGQDSIQNFLGTHLEFLGQESPRVCSPANPEPSSPSPVLVPGSKPEPTDLSIGNNQQRPDPGVSVGFGSGF